MGTCPAVPGLPAPVEGGPLWAQVPKTEPCMSQFGHGLHSLSGQKRFPVLKGSSGRWTGLVQGWRVPGPGRQAGSSVLSASFVLGLAHGHCSITASAFGMWHILLDAGNHPPE